MLEVCKERTEPAHAGLLFCPVEVQTAYRIVNDCHQKDPASCDILSPLRGGSREVLVLGSRLLTLPKNKVPGLCLHCPREALVVCAEPRSGGVLL